MASKLEPIKAVKCTYEDCQASFDSVKLMKSHKKHSPEHDYCHKCDEDFDSYDDLSQHKAFRPDNHGKACRVCGEEYKSVSGLQRHIELYHKLDQKLGCVGCGEQFHRGSALIFHLETGECKVIQAGEFHGLIVHKYLLAELLKGDHNMVRFMQKIQKFDASIDQEDEGGISLLDEMNQEALNDLNDLKKYDAITPEVPETEIKTPQTWGSFPPLPPSKATASGPTSELSSKATASGPTSELSSQFDRMSLGRGSEVGSGRASESVASSTIDAKSASTLQSPKPWDSGLSSSALFPKAKATPATKEWSVLQHDGAITKEEGVNILKTRFWDPTDRSWNPERFYDSVQQIYYCPFVCEQSFDIANDLDGHIMRAHRIKQMRCPKCLKVFQACWQLVAHCEVGTKKCSINQAQDYGLFLDKLTGGFLRVDERVRPDHLHNPAVMVKNPETGKSELYKPPTATYLKYTVSKPVDWQDSRQKASYTIGRGNNEQNPGLMK